MEQGSDETTIAGFLDELAADPGLYDEYVEDPVGVLERTGLPSEKRGLILEGTIQQLRDALQAEVGPHPYVIVRVIVRPPSG